MWLFDSAVVSREFEAYELPLPGNGRKVQEISIVRAFQVCMGFVSALDMGCSKRAMALCFAP